MGVVGFLLLAIVMGYLNAAMCLFCYRCDNHNRGSTCDAIPANRHLRNYGEEETCLSYEEVNDQYLALQRDLDSEWYFSPLNGDHGIPIHLLLEDSSISGGNITSSTSLTLIHADRDFVCLFVRSIFHHNFDPTANPRDPPEEPPHTVYFRKCVQLPSLDRYPVCTSANIYKGLIEICVCRDDKCNLNYIESAHRPHTSPQSQQSRSLTPRPRSLAEDSIEPRYSETVENHGEFTGSNSGTYLSPSFKNIYSFYFLCIIAHLLK